MCLNNSLFHCSQLKWSLEYSASAFLDALMSLNSSNLLPTGPCSFNLQWHNEFSFITIDTFWYVRSPSLKTARLPRWELSTQMFHAVWCTYQFFSCYFAAFRNRPNNFLKRDSFCKGWCAPSLHLHAPNKLSNMKDLVTSFLVEAKPKRTLWKASTSYVLGVRQGSTMQQSNFLPKWYMSFDVIGDSDFLKSKARWSLQSRRQAKCWYDMFFW